MLEDEPNRIKNTNNENSRKKEIFLRREKISFWDNKSRLNNVF
jgi:hypothetical protein